MVVNSSWCNFLGLQHCNENYKYLFLYWKMASIFVYIFLPLAGLTIVWKRNEIFHKFWTNVEHYYLAVIFHSVGKQKLVLNWAKQRLPPNWSSYMETLSGGIADFWTDGSLLCTLINTAVPGACSNPYRHWQKTPVHSQEIAYKYLAIYPIFSDLELTSTLTPYLEKKLLNYLALLQKSISKLEKEKLYYNFISSRYIVRGMGLYTAEQFKESEFFIYSKIQSISFYNVEIFILGPYSTYCKTTVLESLVKESKRSANDSKTNNGWLKARESYLEKLQLLNDSPRHFEGSIKIKVKLECDRVKINYTSKNYGIHEINLSCDKEIIMGSPFYVNVLKSSNKSTEKENDEVKDRSVINSISSGYTVKNIDSQQHEAVPQENEILANKSNKKNSYNNKNEIIKTNLQQRGVESDMQTNKYFDKTLSAKTDSGVELPKVNNYNLNKEDTLEISKYLKDLSCKPKENVDLNNYNSPDPPNSSEDTHSSFIFSKENYSCFQRAVDSSFRRSCRITRKFPTLVQQDDPVVSSASPICSDHTVPEDLRKPSAEEKREQFSLQKSVTLEPDDQRTSSSFSINENQKEFVSSNEDKNLEEGSVTNGIIYSCEKINNKDFNKFVNIDNINKDDSKIYRLVKEKRLFWETVFQNSNNNYTAQYIKNMTHNSNSTSTLIKDDIAKTTNSDKKKLSTNKLDSDVNNKCENASAPHGLKHVDSLSLLKNRNLSMSYGDLRYGEKKRNLVTYKSLDDNLEQCCNVSLDNRARIYLDHVSSFKRKSKDGFQASVKLKVENPVLGLKWKPTDRAFKFDTLTECTATPNNDCSSERKQKKTKKITFKKAIEYFKNLQPITRETFVNQITPINKRNEYIKRHNSFSSGDLDSTIILQNNSKEMNNNNTADNSTYSNTEINRINVIATYSRLKNHKLKNDKDKIQQNIEIPRHFKC